MAPQRGKMDRKTDQGREHKVKKSDLKLQEIEDLETRSREEAPEPGAVTRRDGKVPRVFDDLPLSQFTQSGLERGNFVRLTKIQQLAIPHALAGRDVLGAAQTGSGKTLAFLVPLVERLYRNNWIAGLGVGGLVISPTRELALQIYEVLRVVGYRHQFTGGLVIGGSSFAKESKIVHQICVLVATPGRLLQHLEQSASLQVDGIQILVLDEADRLMDMGFKEQLAQILDYLPKDRQTLLFSATQSKAVKNLAKLSLRRPEYVSVLQALSTSENGGDRVRVPTPLNLVQAYAICQLPDKLDMIYSFIRSHLKSKVIIFFSSCKQVKYVDAAFRKLRPGVPLMSLHGKIKQQKRMYIYYDFIKKPAAVMFATDVAARGLDFPSVDWVVQADCPEDVPGYIHRVGRTARFKSKGRSLLLLLPNEAEAMVPLLRNANIPITERKINPNRQQSIRSKLQSEIAKDQELKMNAQRAFKSYIRSVHLQPNKDVFDVKKLPMGAYATSLGLINTPRIKIQGHGGEKSRTELREKKNVPHAMAKLAQLEELEGGDDEGDMEDVLHLVERVKANRLARRHAENTKKLNKWERIIKTTAADPVAQSRKDRADSSSEEESEDEDEEDFEDGLRLKGTQAPIVDDENLELVDVSKIASKKQLKRLRIDKSGTAKGRAKPQRQEFDEDGNVVSAFEKLADEINDKSGEGVVPTLDDREAYLERMRQKLFEEDKEDKARDKARLKEARYAKKAREKARRLGLDPDAEEFRVTLGNADDSEGEENDAGSDVESASDQEDEEEEDTKPKKRARRGEPVAAEDLEAAALRLLGQE
mmetsp:Transcript_1486/g.2350  ORF Transcript_1486/g.2350 Transcript_1486/m.2350 type:complete len:817 (-) Transcript_1486:48-2498(-)